MAGAVKVNTPPQVLGGNGQPIPGAPTLDTTGNIIAGTGIQSNGSYQGSSTSTKTSYGSGNIPSGSIYGKDGSITAPDGTVIQKATGGVDTTGKSGSSSSADTTLPRVTPTPETIGTKADYSGTAPNQDNPPIPPAPTEDQTYQKLLDQSSGLIKSTTDIYNKELQDAQLKTSAVEAASGLGGSSTAIGMDEATAAPILQKRTQDLSAIYDSIQKNAQTLNQQQFSNTETLKQDQIQATATAKANATDAVKAMAANHLDWANYKQTNPDNYNALVKSLGGDPNYADALFASSIPPQNVQQSWVSGSTFNQLTTDPVTGKPSIQSYDLGVKIPQNWTADKIGTNAVIYHGPNWDPTDPSTYQTFAVDPSTGLPTTQTGGLPNSTGPAPVSDLTTAISNVESGGSYTSKGPILKDGQYAGQQALGKYQIVPGAWFDQIGLDPNNPDDIQTFLESPQMQDQLENTILTQLNAQYPGNQGKAIAAYFGGSAAADAYGTPKGDTMTDGNMSVNEYVKKVQSGLPQNISPADATAKSYADGIMNGTITSLASVPKAYKDKVANLLDKTNGSSYTPLAGSRYTMESNRIVSNYTQLPAYQLTAGGQLYLGRINAALKSPGSVSDQDLLDSLTKLNTGGNAISDAQVKLITDGQSFADSASVWGNKLKNGGVLSDNQRDQIHTLAANIFKSYQDAYQPVYQQASKQLTDAGIPKAFWTIPDLNTLTVNSDQKDISTGDNSNIISKGTMNSSDFVEKSLTNRKINYNDFVKAAPNGEIPVIDNATGNTGYIPESEYDSSKYTRA